MKYKVVAPSFLYFANFGVRFIGALFLSFLLRESLTIQEPVLSLFLATCAGGMFWWSIYVINKFIYAKIDFESKEFIYGNLFFKNRMPIEEVQLGDRNFFYKNVLRIVVRNKSYSMLLFPDDEVEKFFNN